MSQKEKTNQNRYPFSKSWRWRIVRLFDLFFDLFSPWFHRRKFPSEIKKILVVRLDHIGDLVSALPVLPLLKHRFPQAQISALVSPEGESLLKSNPFVDEIITFRGNWFSRKRWSNPFEVLHIIGNLRKKHFDIGFDLRGDLRNILLMVLGNVRYRVGYGIAGGSGLLHHVSSYDPALHQVELNARLVTDKSIGKMDLKPEIHLNKSEKSDILKELERFSIPSGSRLIAIHPEAGYPSKEWGNRKFEKVIKNLLEDSQNIILIFGTTGKTRNLTRWFLNSKQVVDLVGILSLRQMIAALSHCQLFIGNDSGPSHIAQALGIPTVVIASGTNQYEQWGVWLEPSRVLKHAVPCSPCYLRYCNIEGHPCLSQISIEEVLKSVRELLPAGVAT